MVGLNWRESDVCRYGIDVVFGEFEGGREIGMVEHSTVFNIGHLG